jgi:general stress protein 26
MSASHTTQEHLYELLKNFDTAMLVTAPSAGDLGARPMAVAELQPDADVYFASSLDSPKIAEIKAQPHVMVTFQSSSQYAVIKGNATVVRDKETIDRLWSEAWRVWFPGGKEDPALCLLRVDATEAEYWDNKGLQGLKFVVNSLRALVEKEHPKSDEKQNAKVVL